MDLTPTGGCIYPLLITQNETYWNSNVIVIHRQGLRPCVTICTDDTVGFAWPHMQSYLYSIIIDCIYYDVGNETTTEIIIVVERIRHKRRLLILL